jgi:excisionase family DNA binding protein
VESVQNERSDLPLRVTITQAARALQVSRSHIYRRIASGDLQVQKDGSRTFITIPALCAYIDSLGSFWEDDL